MKQIKNESNRRGISRLCHFTQSRNLGHIFGDIHGLFSTKTLKRHDMPHNPTDPNRFDGHDHLVCCSIEYPNTYYFELVRNRDRLFKDWVVLFIEPNYLWSPDTHFCPCNASRDRGQHVSPGIVGFNSLFARSSPGNFTRASNHLEACPTDIQAEVLVKDPITLDSIKGIAVKSEDQAKRELFRLKLQEIELDKPIFIVPEFYDRSIITQYIRSGSQVKENLYSDGELP